MLLTVLMLPASAWAQRRCLDPDGEGGAKIRARETAQAKARAKAIRKRGWTPVDPVSMRNDRRLWKQLGSRTRHEGPTFQRGHLLTLAAEEDGGTPETLLYLGSFDPSHFSHTSWAMTADGEVFEVEDEVTFKATEKAVVCGCADSGGGAQPAPELYFARTPPGARLGGPRTVTFTFRAPRIVWSRGPCPPRP